VDSQPHVINGSAQNTYVQAADPTGSGAQSLKPPLITIGLATFNAKDTAARALQSALAQTWRPLEIVIVDDASIDGTVAILKEIAARHSNVRILCNYRNGGIAAVRNQMIEEARGELLTFFDDDDVSVPERVERQFARLTKYERQFGGGASVICHSARSQIYPDGAQRIERTIGTRERYPAPAGPAVAKRILMGTPSINGFGSCATCSQMARTATYRTVGGFDRHFRRSEDTEFCVRLARYGGHFPGIALPLVIQNMTKAADKGLEQERRDTLRLLSKHRDFIANDSLYQFCCEWTELKFLWLGKRHNTFVARLAQLGSRHPVLTAKRLLLSLPGLGTNIAFAGLHQD
jgi:glycosyltransferase involved in cell wall biosynthesis